MPLRYAWVRLSVHTTRGISHKAGIHFNPSRILFPHVMASGSVAIPDVLIDDLVKWQNSSEIATSFPTILARV